MPTFTRTEIPTEAEADKVIEDFVSDGCTATKEKQADGTWTVVADCPDE